MHFTTGSRHSETLPCYAMTKCMITCVRQLRMRWVFPKHCIFFFRRQSGPRKRQTRSIQTYISGEASLAWEPFPAMRRSSLAMKPSEKLQRWRGRRAQNACFRQVVNSHKHGRFCSVSQPAAKPKNMPAYERDASEKTQTGPYERDASEKTRTGPYERDASDKTQTGPYPRTTSLSPSRNVCAYMSCGKRGAGQQSCELATLLLRRMDNRTTHALTRRDSQALHCITAGTSLRLFADSEPIF